MQPIPPVPPPNALSDQLQNLSLKAKMSKERLCKSEQETFADLFKKLPSDVQAHIFMPNSSVDSVKDDLRIPESMLRIGLDVLEKLGNDTLSVDVKNALQKHVVGTVLADLIAVFDGMDEKRLMFHVDILQWLKAYITLFSKVLKNANLANHNDVTYILCLDNALTEMVSWIYETYRRLPWTNEQLVELPTALANDVSVNWRLIGFGSKFACKDEELKNLSERFINDIKGTSEFNAFPQKDGFPTPNFPLEQMVSLQDFKLELQKMASAYQSGGSRRRRHLHGFTKHQILGLHKYVRDTLKDARRKRTLIHLLKK